MHGDGASMAITMGKKTKDMYGDNDKEHYVGCDEDLCKQVDGCKWESETERNGKAALHDRCVKDK